MNKVVLIYPKTGQDRGISVSPPHSLLTVAAYIKDKYKVVIVDMRIDKKWKDTVARHLGDAVCVGISSMIGTQLKYALYAADFVRTAVPEIPIVWGGIHVTTLPEQSIKDPLVDYIVRHEGEITFAELLPVLERFGRNFRKAKNDLKKIAGICFKADGKIYTTEPRPFLTPDMFPNTPWELIDVEKYIYREGLIDGDGVHVGRVLDIGSTSRGCSRGCKFCFQTVFNSGMWRPLNVTETVKKFIDNAERFNLDGIWIRDDNFFLNPRRAEKVALMLIKEMKERGLFFRWYSSGIDIRSFYKLGADRLRIIKKSGCNTFRFGIESGCNRILKFIGKGFTVGEVIRANKWMARNKFIPHYAFMGGFPTETYGELLKTIELIDKLGKDNPLARLHQLSIFNPIPGTPLFYTAIRHGFRPYGSLREYAMKSHFFSKNLDNFGHLLIDRDVINNISDMSYLINDYLKYAVPIFIRPFMGFIRKYFMFLWKSRRFRNRPEVTVYRFIRNKALGIE